MKRILFLVAFGFSFSLFAQNITLISIGYGNANSRTESLAEAHVNLQNNASTAESYLLKRVQVGSTGLVDSNYFCWDLCYPTWVNQSQGTVMINPGAVAYDFSGYAYVMDTAANGQDTVWYTFENIADSTDFLTVPVIYFFSPTMGQDESTLSPNKIYPNPNATGCVTMEFTPFSAASSIEVLDVLGRIQAIVEVPAQGTKVVWQTDQVQSGLYLLRRRMGHPQENLGKVLIQ